MTNETETTKPEAGTELVSFLVTEEAMRPASDKRECFYCNQPIGEIHKLDCVLINKKVKIRMIVEYEASVPASWDKNQIEFHRNDGTWCANNAIEEFDREDVSCMCGNAEFEYIGGDSDPYLDES